MEQHISFTMGAKQMLSDFGQIIKLALTTKFGLVITLLCVGIYFLSLWIVGGVQKWGLLVWLLSFIGFIGLSWATWFSVSIIDNEQRDY